MLESIKVINSYVSSADPDRYDSVGYSKYFSNLASISDSILEDNKIIQNGMIKLLLEANKLPESENKKNIIAIIENILK